ncbi:MAG: peptidase [Spirochaetes bacterium GWD1_27_9]|nr:MAG: peptidase [Spirochaetes bacterium GWB1_27_13]OHD20266.1 MAG: peptidase [Spirochaetes bacterium GWC1_27_15]OHD35280.1 MAG: peptidase [Spirochaetes bacterium GWD1_27_9]
MLINIQKGEIGLLFKDGNYVKLLEPKKYFLFKFLGFTVKILDVNKIFNVEGKNINLFLEDKELISKLDLIEVKDNELYLHFEDDKFKEIYRVGKYAFWNILKKNTFIKIDLNNPEIPDNIDDSILKNPKLSTLICSYEILPYQEGLLFFNGVYQRTLKSGRYYFWNVIKSVTANIIDLRQLQLDIAGQEIMTEDKITLRLNFVCHYKIKDSLKAILTIKNYEEQIYILLQLILREYVGTLKLDDLLKKKEEIGEYILRKLIEKSESLGIEFLFAGLKDVILPGEIKDILNTVLIAEKKAQANIITRREEIASTRSLLNTAKLLDENKTLYRLKELEYLEKICDKIGNISLLGGGSLIEHLNSLLSSPERDKK